MQMESTVINDLSLKITDSDYEEKEKIKTI